MKKSEGNIDKEYSLKILISAVVSTILVLMAVVIPLHNIVIDGKNSTIEALKTKLEGKEDHLIGKDVILEDYRTRLGILEGNQTSYSILANQELKKKSMSLISTIRKLLIEYRTKSDSLLYAPDRTKNWDKHNRESSQLSTSMMLKYNHSYKIDAILLRDEILSRLPKKMQTKDNKREYHDYEHPTNPIGLGFVADHLEKITRLLID